MIKKKSKQTKKVVSLEEADEILGAGSQAKKYSKPEAKKEETKKPKKTLKSSENKKKIRKK